jgi:hypothetical protein
MLDFCVEKLHRVPEECPHVSMVTFYQMVELEDRRVKRIEAERARNKR